MDCPNCRTGTLGEYRVKGTGVKVDVCAQCRGIWFDGGELDGSVAVAAKELRVPSGAASTRRVCPRCNEPLYASKYPQTLVIVDMCKQCNGLWLDAGELTELQAVRSAMKRRGELEELAPVTGAKGALLRFVDTAIGALKPF